MIRIERAIRHLARERNQYLLRLELCGSEREPVSGYVKLEIPVSEAQKDELFGLLDRWKERGEI